MAEPNTRWADKYMETIPTKSWVIINPQKNEVLVLDLFQNQIQTCYKNKTTYMQH